MNIKERRNKKNELNILNDLITVINQYFPELINKFNGLTDLRNQSYVKYKNKNTSFANTNSPYLKAVNRKRNKINKRIKPKIERDKPEYKTKTYLYNNQKLRGT